MVDVDNSSRIIKYVVLRSDRYSDHAMPEMRFHDINVVADLNAHDPTVVNPRDVELDGTTQGTLTNSWIEQSDAVYSDAMNIVDIYWTGPWPLLHYEWEYELVQCNIPSENELKPLGNKKVTAHIAKNLLGEDEIKVLSVPDDVEYKAKGEETEDIIKHYQIQLILVGLWLWGIAVEAAMKTGQGWLVGASLAAAVLIGYLAHKIFLDHTMNRIQSGSWDLLDAAINWLALGVEAMVAVLGGPKALFALFTGGVATLFAYGIAEWSSVSQAVSRTVFGTVFVMAWTVVAFITASLFFTYYVTGTPIV